MQAFNIIIDHGISSPGHDRKVLYGLNATYKRFILHMMYNVQLPGIERFDTQMVVKTATQNSNVSLTQELQKHLSNA